MSDMYSIIAKLCKQRGIKVGKMCSDTGISRGVLSDLNNGRTKNLSYKNMVKIANYFDISVDVFKEGVPEDLLANQRDCKNHLVKEKPATISDDELNRINSIFSQLDPDNRAKLLELAFLYLDAQHKNKENQ